MMAELQKQPEPEISKPLQRLVDELSQRTGQAIDAEDLRLQVGRRYAYTKEALTDSQVDAILKVANTPVASGVQPDESQNKVPNFEIQFNGQTLLRQLQTTGEVTVNSLHIPEQEKSVPPPTLSAVSEQVKGFTQEVSQLADAPASLEWEKTLTQLQEIATSLQASIQGLNTLAAAQQELTKIPETPTRSFFQSWTQGVQETYTNIRNAATQTINQSQSALTEFQQNTESWVKSRPDAIKTHTEQFMDSVKADVDIAQTKLSNTAENAIEKTKETLTNAKDTAIEKLKDSTEKGIDALGKSLMQLGEDLYQRGKTLESRHEAKSALPPLEVLEKNFRDEKVQTVAQVVKVLGNQDGLNYEIRQHGTLSTVRETVTGTEIFRNEGGKITEALKPKDFERFTAILNYYRQQRLATSRKELEHER